MSDTTPSYTDLRTEGSWIDYIRTRLPYSFNRIQSSGSGPARHFILSEPILITGGLSGTHHNYWRRGNVYYMSGKLLDYFLMPDIGQQYRMQAALQLLTDTTDVSLSFWSHNTFAFYNSMQLEQVWGFVQDNHLDRERVMMTSVTQAIELCLKAITTHAAFRETSCFKFHAGHNIAKLYEDLPSSLRDEITEESNVFAKDYVAFRKQLDADIKRLMAFRPQLQAYPDAIKQAEADWNQMAKRIGENSYTAFVNSNDPGAGDRYLHEGWFEEALDQMRLIEAHGDISQYFRYAPQEDTDELPTDLIHWVLLLGRFMYEHLFPVPSSDNRPRSGFPIR